MTRHPLDLPADVYAELRREGFVEWRDEEAANEEDARWAAERDAGLDAQ